VKHEMSWLTSIRDDLVVPYLKRLNYEGEESRRWSPSPAFLDIWTQPIRSRTISRSSSRVRLDDWGFQDELGFWGVSCRCTRLGCVFAGFVRNTVCMFLLLPLEPVGLRRYGSK
jgi:hypothetical protein